MPVNIPISEMFDDEECPLMDACGDNNLERVRSILQHSKEDLNKLSIDENDTPLILACRQDSIQLAKILIDAGADINKESINATPLALACEKGNYELVSLLLENGANPNRYALFGEIPLFEACAISHYNIIELLLQKGAEVNKKDRDGDRIIFVVACTMACQKRELSLKIVRLLMNYGADIKAPNKIGETPLEIANHYKHKELIELLTKGDPPVEMIEPDFVISTLSHFLKGPISKDQYREFLSCVTKIF